MAVQGIPNCLRCGGGLNFEHGWWDGKSQTYGVRLKLFFKMSSSILTVLSFCGYCYTSTLKVIKFVYDLYYSVHYLNIRSGARVPSL